MAVPIDGKSIAATIRAELTAEVEAFGNEYGRRPSLAAVLVGEHAASHIYVRNKIKACELAGIRCESHQLSESITQNEVVDLIRKLNDTDIVDGILLQLPLPEHLDKTTALDAIHPAKDVDGLHPTNVGLLVQGRAALIACTPLGVMEALRRSGVDVAGKRAAVIGRSDLVGKPMALLLLQENATVTVCHSRTQNLGHIISESEIVVAALGRAGFVMPEMIQEGAVLIDVGINLLSTESEVLRIYGQSSPKIEQFHKGKNVLAGDIHPDAYLKSSVYTPVPGGVGPLTVAMLLRNTLTAAKLRIA